MTQKIKITDPETYFDKKLRDDKISYICNIDNKNQNYLRHDLIRKETYAYNKEIIHKIYDNVDKYNYFEIVSIFHKLRWNW